MEKGNKFLKLTVILVVAVFIFLFFLYDRPPEADVPTGGTKPSTPGGPVVTNCGSDIVCFEAAIKDGCKSATFTLPDPSNETALLEGAVTGQVLSKCRIRIESPDTGESMDCLVDESSFSSIGSLAALKSLCSGELLARITA